METLKNITVSVMPGDIKADRTDSGQLIDKLAMAMGEWTSTDLEENNFDYQDEGARYLLKEYDYEDRALELLNGKRTLKTLIALKELKAVLIDKISNDMEYAANKKKAEREKRAEENKKKREYKDEREAQAEAKRIEKLKAMAR